MPLAPNVLLQANSTTATSKTTSASNSVKPADNGKDDNASFSSVYAKQAQAKSDSGSDSSVKSARDKNVADKGQQGTDKSSGSSNAAASSDQATVADSGNALPVDPAAAVTRDDQSPAGDEVVDPSLLAALNPEPQAELVVDPALDPTLQAMVAQPTVAPAALPVEAAKVETPAVAAPLLAAQQPALAAVPVQDETFDPEADPLADMPALQFALESAGGKAQQAVQNTNTNPNVADADRNARSNDEAADLSRNLANNLTSLMGQPSADDASTESSDESFGGVIDGGLKEAKTVGGDTRVDNFADRLAALSQAAHQSRAVQAPAVPLLNQPLAMHQSGWSEGIVDRVMYLSSQNLKSADIQLEPAELGRLDIRVNMAPDQQTQVTFMSAHVGVREALESQMSRLRESMSQQGMGQVDVNVSDQPQGWQQQAQQQAENNSRGTGSRNGSGGDDAVDEGVADAAVPVSQPAARVIGSSEIDFYA